MLTLYFENSTFGEIQFLASFLSWPRRVGSSVFFLWSAGQVGSREMDRLATLPKVMDASP